MTTLVKIWNTDENYWVLHPIMKTIKVFRQFYEKDKSKDKKESSKIMWAIALLLDPNDANPWRNSNILDRDILIREEFLENPKFNWDHPEIEELKEAYKEFCLTIAEKELIAFEKKLNQRGRFIDNTDYSMDSYSEDTGRVTKGTADQLDKMMLNTSKIFEQYTEIKNNLIKEQSEGTLRGGAEESASEKGEL